MAHLRVTVGVMDHLMVRLVEWSAAAVLCLFGVTLLEPGSSFASPSYAVLARIAGENAWGWFFVLVGGARLIVLGLDGACRWFQPVSIRARGLAAMACSVAWFALAYGLYRGNPLSTGSRTYAAFLVVDLITALYLQRQADRQARGLLSTETR